MEWRGDDSGSKFDWSCAAGGNEKTPERNCSGKKIDEPNRNK